MDNKKLTLLFDLEWFEKLHLYKDVGMIPIYFNRIYDFNSTIVFYDNIKNSNLLPKELGINLIRIKKNVFNKIKFIRRYITPMNWYLIKNSKNIDVLMLFHIKNANFYYRFLYKLFNPKGKIYLKLDMDLRGIDFLENLYKAEMQSKNIFKYEYGFFSYLETMKNSKEFKKIKKQLAKFDVVSVETKYAFDKVHELFGESLKHNLKLITNGFSYEGETKNKIKKFEEKENIIITVGRIGALQKNNKMLLEAVKKINLKDWKVVFIGPVEEAFISIIKEFYDENPALADKVEFVGNVNSKDELYHWYNKSKVFCLTSKYEGFPLVFTEAIYFGNYIISTEVGAEIDITNGGINGKIIRQGNTDKLAEELQKIIDGENDIVKVYDKIIKYSREKFVWKNIVPILYEGLMK